jgi:hypothetical protein
MCKIAWHPGNGPFVRYFPDFAAGGPKNLEPTIRRVAERARDIFSADLTYLIIMTRSGEVFDGAHRIAKAYLQGERTIAAVVIDDYPPPDGVAEVPQS